MSKIWNVKNNNLEFTKFAMKNENNSDWIQDYVHYVVAF